MVHFDPDTASDGMALTPLEQDALTELVNIGVSGAASGLRKLVDRPVILSVPALEVVSRKVAAAFIGEREGSKLVAVKQQFTGAFTGEALLIFPEQRSWALARSVVGDDDATVNDADLEEALTEIGNIILSHCVGTLGNQLKLPVTLSLPHLVRGSEHLLFDSIEQQDDVVLILHINFAIVDLDTRGYIALLMRFPSIGRLKDALAEFINFAMDETK